MVETLRTWKRFNFWYSAVWNLGNQNRETAADGKRNTGKHQKEKGKRREPNLNSKIESFGKECSDGKEKH